MSSRHIVLGAGAALFLAVAAPLSAQQPSKAQADSACRSLGKTAEECKKFGNVMQSRIFERSDDVRIFIKFDNEVTAKRAIDALNGRLFGGRRIRATSYDAESFAKEDLDL